MYGSPRDYESYLWVVALGYGNDVWLLGTSMDIESVLEDNVDVGTIVRLPVTLLLLCSVICPNEHVPVRYGHPAENLGAPILPSLRNNKHR